MTPKAVKSGRPDGDSRPAVAPRVTIADVAMAAGVRPSTVSKALNDGRGSAEVRQRVEEAVARLGYRPSQRAQALRTSRAYSIGVLVPDLANPSYLSLLRGVENVAHERGYVVLVGDGQRSTEVQNAALERFFQHGVDGVVLGGPVAGDALRLHLRHGVPITPTVSDDERALARNWEQNEAAATREMGRRLLALGHRRFGFVTTPRLEGGGRFRRGRLTALSAVVAEAGADLAVTVVEPDGDPKRCLATLRRMFDGGPVPGSRPTALVCANQRVAPWLLMALADSGLGLPGDASLVVYGDSDWVRAHRPALSVVTRDTFSEGRSLATALLDTIEGAEPDPRLLGEATYLERGSCGPAPAGPWQEPLPPAPRGSAPGDVPRSSTAPRQSSPSGEGPAAPPASV